MRSRNLIIALSLSALLGLGACGKAATQEQPQDQQKVEAQETTPSAVVADAQSIGLEGVINARQLGGYVGADGRKVKDGLLLRTAALGNATDADVSRLKDVYHLAEVIDFRMTAEVAANPDLEIEGVKNLNLLIIDEDALAQEVEALSPEDQAKTKSSDTAERLGAFSKTSVMNDQMYVFLLSHEVGKQGYERLFDELLALPEGSSLLFHCTQGKDRTGCAAMLILSALGVDEDTIMQDFLLTNEFNADLIAKERQELTRAGVADQDMDRIMLLRDQVFPEAMENVLTWTKENYGSPVGYISEELGVTEEEIQQLRDKFLE